MIRNVHERVVDAPIERLGALLDGLGRKGDRLWPSRNWPPMVLDRPVSAGGEGGHGAIRYHVTEYEPGARVRFAFDPATGIEGAHELSLDALSNGRCRMRHVLVGRARGRMRLLDGNARPPRTVDSAGALAPVALPRREDGDGK